MKYALASGHISGDGSFSSRCRALLEAELQVKRALLTPSCTHALELSALLIDLQPGDEVILPSFTFPSTANAFVLRGAQPRFVDIRPDTLNLDEDRVEAAVTSRTKAIIVVHYAGVACEMQRILEIAHSAGLVVIEDNAHGLFGRFKGRQLGTFGTFSCQSFHETKNITCGEGGALLINNPAYIERAEILREKGTDRSRFFRGLADKYTWVDVGSSYLPSDLLAAMLYGQLEARHTIQAKRRAVWERYYAGLREWACESGVALPHVPPDCEQPFHMFYLRLPDEARRNAFIQHMQAAGVMTVFHYQPLHLSDMGRRFGGRRGDCPVAENASARIVRLPFFNELSPADQHSVIEAVQQFRC